MSSTVTEEYKAERSAGDEFQHHPRDGAADARPHGRSLGRFLRTSEGRLALLVGLIALAVYVRTLAISIIWGDSPELTAAAYNLGIPHPTGYPLYMLISHAFLRVFPFGSVAYRMNLLSALCGAGAV